MVAQEIPGLLDSAPFLAATDHRDMSVRGQGDTVGWYLGADDGLPRRLPVMAAERDHYEQISGGRRGQRLIFQRDWGIYSSSGTFRRRADGTTVHIPLEGKYEQLARIAREYPEARVALGKLYTRRAQPVQPVWTCACGQQFSVAFAIEIHQSACPQHIAGLTVGEPTVAAVSLPPAAAAVAPTVKPAMPVLCRKCDAGPFPSTIVLAQHTRREHRKKKQPPPED